MGLLKLRKFAQVTLPADLRKKFNLTEGDFLEAEAVEKGILLKPVTVVEREKAWNQVFKSMENVKDRKPSKKAIKAFEGTIKEGTVVVPAVVLAEIMYISKRGKIALSFEETVKKIEEYENFDIAPLDINILKTADRVKTDTEMHDKLIVATALYYEAKLITRDEQIKKAGIVPVVW